MSEPRTPNIRIMVIDDIRILCEMIRDTLRNTGYEVITFTDPIEALANIPEWKPDIIILDYAMPELDGSEVLEMIKSIRKDTGLNIGILGLSGSHPEAHHKFMEGGVDDYMDKPFRRFALIHRIERIYRTRHPYTTKV
jgi:CheY-like chemotaxis protein